VNKGGCCGWLLAAGRSALAEHSCAACLAFFLRGIKCAWRHQPLHPSLECMEASGAKASSCLCMTAKFAALAGIAVFARFVDACGGTASAVITIVAAAAYAAAALKAMVSYISAWFAHVILVSIKGGDLTCCPLRHTRSHKPADVLATGSAALHRRTN